MIIPVIIISLFCTLPFSSVLYHVRVYFMRCTLYASSLILSISRREEAFPLAQHFHPDHHDPDDRVPLTVRRVFSLFLFLSFSLFRPPCFYPPREKLLSVRELQTSPSERTVPWKSRRGTIRGVFSSRESEERNVASDGEPAHREERSERDREESTWAEGVGTRGEREGETAEKTGFLADQATNRRPETQVTHPDSTNNQTPSILRPFYHPVQLRSATLLFFVALLPSLHHGSSAFAPRGKHRGVWKILTSEASSPGSSACMAPNTTRAGAREKREG